MLTPSLSTKRPVRGSSCASSSARTRHGGGLRALRQALGIVEPLDRLHGGADIARGDAQAIVLADPQRLVAEPHQAGAEDVGLDRRVLLQAGDGAALDEELLVQREADGLAGLRLGGRHRNVPAFDAGDARHLVARRKQQAVADAQAARLEAADEDAPLVELVDVLDRQAQRQLGRPRRRAQAGQRLHHGGSVIPRHGLGGCGDVVAVAGGDGYDDAGAEADAVEIRRIGLADLVVARLSEPNGVHLVDDHRHLADAQQMQEEAVEARLLLDALAGVDQHQRGVGARRARDHVLDELAVAGRVDDDVVAGGRAQPDLRGVDGDALVALVLEGIHEEGPLEGHAAPLAHDLDGLELALG
jgi:hypothetical protein